MPLAPEGTEFWRADHSPIALTPPLHPHFVSSGSVRYSWKEGEKTLWLERRAEAGDKDEKGFPMERCPSLPQTQVLGVVRPYLVSHSFTHSLLPFITTTSSLGLDHSSSSAVLVPPSLRALSAMQMLVAREIA